MPTPNLLFVSFPRSGAHLLRALLEACTNHYMETTKMFPDKTTGACLGLHTHDLDFSHLAALQTKTSPYTHLLVVTRDPLDVLHSQCEYYGYNWWSEHWRNLVERTFVEMRAHQKTYEQAELPLPKLTLSYDWLVSNPAGAVCSVCCFLGLAQPSEEQMRDGIAFCTKTNLRVAIKHDPKAISPETNEYNASRKQFRLRYQYLMKQG